MDLILEFLMFLYECYRKHNLEQQRVDVLVRQDEDGRRQLYSKTYFSRTITVLSFAIVSVIILSFTLPDKQCMERQYLSFNTVCQDCQVERCDYCFKAGINKCDWCETGYFFNGEICSKCDHMEDTITCTKCHEKGYCFECASGYRLVNQGGMRANCVTCNDANCDQCNTELGYCEKCLDGYYLDKNDYSCQPCGGACQKCDSQYKCTQCDEKVSELRDNQCVCKTWEFWYIDDSYKGNFKQCKCGKKFINVEGKCTDCPGIIEGCSSCVFGTKQDAANSYVYLGDQNIQHNEYNYLTC